MQKGIVGVGVPLEFKVGDLIKAKQCWHEQKHGVPEYGLVIDTEIRKSIKQEV